jgi:hypothetical protein
MDELYPEMGLDEKPHTPNQWRSRFRGGMLRPADLQATMRTVRDEARMRAALQATLNDRLCDTVSVKARVDAAIQWENGHEQAEPIALNLVAVWAGVLIERTDDAEELDKLMLLEP